MQKGEEKKSAGPKPIRNHQQRLENIVKQTTVETRVRHSNTYTHTCVSHLGGLTLTYIDLLEVHPNFILPPYTGK